MVCTTEGDGRLLEVYAMIENLAESQRWGEENGRDKPLYAETNRVFVGDALQMRDAFPGPVQLVAQMPHFIEEGGEGGAHIGRELGFTEAQECRLVDGGCMGGRRRRINARSGRTLGDLADLGNRPGATRGTNARRTASSISDLHPAAFRALPRTAQAPNRFKPGGRYRRISWSRMLAIQGNARNHFLAPWPSTGRVTKNNAES